MTQECPPTIAEPLPAFPTEGGVELGTAYLVSSRRDVDFNGHINNSAYLTWALDSVPNAPGSAPSKIRIQYKRESHAGEAMSIRHMAAGQLTRHSITSQGELRADILLSWEA